ncbi:MAG: ATP-binding cassette domain-containing protein [Dehalogenimonas sp.]|uniref:ATP-binding cassette domain-containing protein n=1 Tax=Candidatus Dehalogenimonas loeffleri TaxID=3127115 RepID=A0ABZ2J4Z0_9CHLR|nr:ATP-binding cassette domain-containing protein [Dehalogenimonas sp.]
MSDCIVKTENLTKRFGDIAAVDSLNMEISRGQVFGFLGPNGSGKTTTIAMMLSLIRPTAGKVYMFGQELSPEALMRVGTVMDTGGFYPDLSGLDNLLIFGGLHQPVGRKRLAEVLETVSLADRAKTKFHTYSMGMKQRLAIALAMLGDPEFYIFDEPTNGMDPEGIADIRGLIIRLAEQGKTVFLASHLLAEVEQVCSHLAILKKGKVVRQGAMEELLFLHGRSEMELSVANPVKTVAILFDAGFDSRIEGDLVIVTAHEGQAEAIGVCLAAEGIYPRGMTRAKSTLESVFLQATES